MSTTLAGVTLPVFKTGLKNLSHEWAGSPEVRR